jgi:hypothetical protein
MYGMAAYMDVDKEKIRGDTLNGPQTHTTRLANTTRLLVLAPATAGGALMDHWPFGLLPIAVQ